MIWCASFDGKIMFFIASSLEEAIEKTVVIKKIEKATDVVLYQNPPVQYLDRLN